MNMLFTYISTALKQLAKNKGRSLLTMLGIIIGIGSVIFIMSTGEVAKNFLLSQISQFGTNVVEIAVIGEFGPFGESEEVTLTEKDVELMYESSLLPEIVGVSAGHSVIETAEHEDEQISVSIMGDRPELFSTNNMKPVKGRLFTDSDVQNAAKVIVIGERFAEDLYGHRDVIGEQLKIGGTHFKIIGLVEDLSMSGMGMATPEILFAPISTIREEFVDPKDREKVDWLLLEFDQSANVDSLVNRIDYVLREEHDMLDSKEEVFMIMSREQALDIFNNVLIAIQAFVSAVAAISLIVGGIGIMNIMLVTVNERTKEIGLRKAIGAKNYSILTQFLVESVVLTTVGGIVGIALGLGLTIASVVAINVFYPDWGVAFVFVPNALIIACGVAVTVGIVFGIYPALKASKLHPIEALRYE